MLTLCLCNSCLFKTQSKCFGFYYFKYNSGSPLNSCTTQFLYLHFFFLTALHSAYRGFPGGSVVKNLPARRRCGFDPWVRKIPWRRQWQPTPVFLPGKPPQRLLAGYKMWCHKSVRHDSVTKQQHRTYI